MLESHMSETRYDTSAEIGEPRDSMKRAVHPDILEDRKLRRHIIISRNCENGREENTWNRAVI